MMPNLDPSKIQKMMKQMGMKTKEIDTTEVIIKTKSGKDIIISSPSVTKVNIKGQDMFQIQGGDVSKGVAESKKEVEIDFDEEDVQTVMEQTGCSEAEAKKTLKKEGDLAKAVMKLSK